MILVPTYLTQFKDVIFNYNEEAGVHSNSANKMYIGGKTFKLLEQYIKLEKSNVHSYIDYRSEVRRRKQNLRRVR